LNCQVRLPAGILKHWPESAFSLNEVKSDNPRYRCFSFDENFSGSGPIPPHRTRLLVTFPYCTTCAGEHSAESPAIAAALVAESIVEAKVWVDGREYSAAKTIKELGSEADARGAA
jgi:hypothetical protein